MQDIDRRRFILSILGASAAVVAAGPAMIGPAAASTPEPDAFAPETAAADLNAEMDGATEANLDADMPAEDAIETQGGRQRGRGRRGSSRRGSSRRRRPRGRRRGPPPGRGRGRRRGPRRRRVCRWVIDPWGRRVRRCYWVR